MTWKDGMKLDPNWNGRQKNWYLGNLKKREPNRYKAEMKSFYENKLKDLE